MPKKYEGLDGTELAISESQERMAVVVAAADTERFLKLAEEENLQACPVALVKDEPRLIMNWSGKRIVDLRRDFLNSNGAPKHIRVEASAPRKLEQHDPESFSQGMQKVASDLNTCSKRGLAERFDSTIGAGTVLMPFGGKYQLTPVQAMVQKIAVENRHTDDCSLMAFGYDPFVSEKSPYHGAYLAVVESVCKLIASGAEFREVYLSFQEYFEHLGKDGRKWGKPLAALLGAFKAQMELGVAAIGGKDSMSGSFEDLSVPPTLVSVAVTTGKTENICSPEFKKAGSRVMLLQAEMDENGLPVTQSLLNVFDKVTHLLRSGRAISCYTPGMGGIAEAVMKMCFGNGFGFTFDPGFPKEKIFARCPAAFLLETQEDLQAGIVVGTVTEEKTIVCKNEQIDLEELLRIYEDKLEPVYPCNIENRENTTETVSYKAETERVASVSCARPKVLIPVFPGTNCEYDSAKAVRDAGAEPEILVINNLTPEGISRSIDAFSEKLKDAQMIFIPGGFSGGDEPDGSGKFITAFFRNAEIRDGVEDLLERRDGLICGICNGFQALIKLGLVPYGRILDPDEHAPTLTYNTIGRHQSRIVRTRIASNKSPWLRLMNVGDIVNVPISHGEGRFMAEDPILQELIRNGQIATQYVDLDGNASTDIHFNPNDSLCSVEGITSPDGRVFGKMGHSERIGRDLYRNVPGNYDIRMFESAVKYFRG